MLSRRDWVLQRQPTPYVLKDGSRIGHRHSLSYRAGLDKPLIVDRVIYVPKDQPQVWEAGIKEALKREAEADILPLLQTTSQRLGLSYGKVTFRYMSSRWGSCNSKGNLSLNTALVYLPQRLVEYVLVHELCHLKYLDHSPLFWRLVEQHLPRTPALRGELKQYLINLVIESPNHQQPR